MYKRQLLRRGLARPISPKTIAAEGLHNVVKKGFDVDLLDIPCQNFGTHDGGPMITAGVTLARDPDGEHGLNAGV